MKSKTPIKLKQLLEKSQAKDREHSSPPQETNQVSPDLKANLKQIKEDLGNSSDIVIREFRAGENRELELAIIFVEGLSDAEAIQNFILETLMEKIRYAPLNTMDIQTSSILDIIKSSSLPVGSLTEIGDFKKLYFLVLSGETILLLDGYPMAISISLKKWADRGIQEPTGQTVVRGPKDGFTETLRTNTALIRRRVRDPYLRLETRQIGKRTQTDVAIMYIKGIANDKTVSELQSRLNKINIDAILESGYIEELIQDEVLTPFPTVFNTERPDTVAGALLEGRIAIFVDGTPFVLIIPALFVHFFHSSEDYYQRADIAVLIRLLRFFAFFLAMLTPSVYISVTTFHQEMLPTPLLISLTAQREGVPFPALVEAIMMEVTFEILREAGLRMPRAIGSSISIVGALVIGQAAVEAGIISAMMVIIVSLTAISSFIFPAYNMSIPIRMLRFVFMILAATFGLFGVILGLIMLVLHLNSLRSFGVPYLAPFSPFILEDQKDSILRLPHWALFSRPRLISQKDTRRERTPTPEPTNN